MPPIPQELFNAIIDHIPNLDIPTLRACALASSVLQVPSQQKLFGGIYIQFSIPLQDPLRHPLARLVPILSASPRLASYVHKLMIIERHPVRGAEWPHDPALPHLVEMLENLSELTLTIMKSWADFSPALQLALQRKFASPKLNTLQFESMAFPDEGIFQSIAPTGSLSFQHLHFESLHPPGSYLDLPWSEQSRIPPVPNSPSRVVRATRLSLGGNHTPYLAYICQSLQVGLDMSALESLSIQVSPLTEESIQDLLVHATQLRSLRINFGLHRDYKTAINLRSLSHLQTVDVSLFFQNKSVNPFEHIANLVSHNTTAPLGLILHVLLREDGVWEHAIDELLHQAKLPEALERVNPRLRSLTVKIITKHWRNAEMRERVTVRVVGQVEMALSSLVGPGDVCFL